MSTALAGKRALVTGGAKGIGRAIAARLAAEGASLALLGRDAAALHRAGEELGATHAVTDVTDHAALTHAIEQLGEFDILVNNAGGASSRAFVKSDPAEWHAMLQVNLLAVFTGCHAVLPGMIARGWGRIVTIASTAGLKGYAYTAAYCAAKHGVIGLTRALALETAKSGVTVNAVCPGFTDTALVERATATIVAETGRSSENARAALARSNPLNRLIAPEEVAEAVFFLCGTHSAAITGQALAVAGGEVM